jgi:hypothetical protein
MNADERRSLPVFIIGCHRCGTTLLRYILDAHPRLACPPESKFIGGLAAMVCYPQALDGLQSMNVSRQAVMEWVREFAERAFSRYAASQGKVRWIDKTPNYFDLLPFIDEMFSQRVLYVLITRCPFDAIASLQASPYFTPATITDPHVSQFVSEYGHTCEAFARYWRHVHSKIGQFNALHPHRTLRVKYEDLVRNPVVTTTGILEFIGERYVDGILEHAFTQPHVHGFGDWKIRSTSKIHADSVLGPGGWPEDERELCWDIVGSVASELGYATP